MKGWWMMAEDSRVHVLDDSSVIAAVRVRQECDDFPCYGSHCAATTSETRRLLEYIDRLRVAVEGAASEIRYLRGEITIRAVEIENILKSKFQREIPESFRHPAHMLRVAIRQIPHPFRYSMAPQNTSGALDG